MYKLLFNNTESLMMISIILMRQTLQWAWLSLQK